ncbi:hypothetical protein C8R46DRAFT_1129909 [Mycena filopes]|nr:hypothetical protein C8R46DRAFT_1129909 [Mycena filopes]
MGMGMGMLRGRGGGGASPFGAAPSPSAAMRGGSARYSDTNVTTASFGAPQQQTQRLSSTTTFGGPPNDLMSFGAAPAAYSPSSPAYSPSSPQSDLASLSFGSANPYADPTPYGAPASAAYSAYGAPAPAAYVPASAPMPNGFGGFGGPPQAQAAPAASLFGGAQSGASSAGGLFGRAMGALPSFGASSPTPSTPADPLEALARLQSFDGCFTLEVLSVVKLKTNIQDVRNAFPAGATDSVIATVLAMAYLATRLGAGVERESWEGIYEKAQQYVEGALQNMGVSEGVEVLEAKLAALLA